MSRADALVLVLLAPSNSPAAVDAAIPVLGEHGLRIREQRVAAVQRFHAAVWTLEASTPVDWRAVSRALRPVQSRLGVDLAVVPAGPAGRTPKVLVMDMDSTLVQSEGIDELAKEAGVGEQVSAITRRAMNGELDFRGALRERVALLRGLDADAFARVEARTRLTPGAETLLATLRKAGCATAVVSGGFEYFTDRLKIRLGLDHTFSNRLEIEAGRLTGRLIGDIVDGDRKAAVIDELAAVYGVTRDRVVAIGDGANDLRMLGLAGMGIAFCAKPAVRDAAPVTVSVKDLSAVLCLLGYNETEFSP